MPKQDPDPSLDRRTFSQEVRLGYVERMAAGEVVSALARELGVHRQLLYKWRDAVRRHGPEPRRRGRPKAARVLESSDRAKGHKAVDRAAAARIAELERLVGRQELELRFFQRALREIEASRRPSDGSGATASSPPSRR